MSMDADNSELFEMPPGIRIVRDDGLADDPDETLIMGPGDLEESEQLLRGFDPEAMIRHVRAGGGTGKIARARSTQGGLVRSGWSPGRGLPDARNGQDLHRSAASRTGLGRARLRLCVGPGARFVYGLILLTLSLGGLGLALSWQSREALTAAGLFSVMSGLVLWVYWRSWLDGFPYVYRLLTSLGEDAENLVRWRLFRRRGVRVAVRSLYR